MDVPAPDVQPDRPDRAPPADHGGLLARVRAVLAEAGFAAPDAAGTGDLQVRSEAGHGMVVTWGPARTGDAPSVGLAGRSPSVRTVVRLAVSGVLIQAGYHAACEADAIVVTGRSSDGPRQAFRPGHR